VRWGQAGREEEAMSEPTRGRRLEAPAARQLPRARTRSLPLGAGSLPTQPEPPYPSTFIQSTPSATSAVASRAASAPLAGRDGGHARNGGRRTPGRAALLLPPPGRAPLLLPASPHLPRVEGAARRRRPRRRRGRRGDPRRVAFLRFASRPPCCFRGLGFQIGLSSAASCSCNRR